MENNGKEARHSPCCSCGAELCQLGKTIGHNVYSCHVCGRAYDLQGDRKTEIRGPVYLSRPAIHNG